jgi:hypothetical protein
MENETTPYIGFTDETLEKQPEALEFERVLWQEHGTEGDPPHDQNILVYIDPQWMEPCDGNDA